MWIFLLFFLTSPFSLSGIPTTAASTIFVDPSNLDSKMDGATSYIQKCIKFSKLSIKYRIPWKKKIPGMNVVLIRLIYTSILHTCPVVFILNTTCSNVFCFIWNKYLVSPIEYSKKGNIRSRVLILSSPRFKCCTHKCLTAHLTQARLQRRAFMAKNGLDPWILYRPFGKT